MEGKSKTKGARFVAKHQFPEEKEMAGKKPAGGEVKDRGKGGEEEGPKKGQRRQISKEKTKNS